MKVFNGNQNLVELKISREQNPNYGDHIRIELERNDDVRGGGKCSY